MSNRSQGEQTLQILGLSNGHGEDAIGAQILQAVRTIAIADQQLVSVTALPLVGEGTAYARADIESISPVRSRPPSGGFIYMDPRQLWRDLQGGLVGVTLRQWQLVKDWTRAIEAAGEQPLVLAVGDIVPLLFAWQSQAPYGFVGTAKSEYYLRDSGGEFLRSRRSEGWSGSVYLPWERWLMARPRCQAVFPRDRLTTEILKGWPIPAVDLGNPMMDGFLPVLGHHGPEPLTSNPPPAPSEPLRILIIPGSRSPEAYGNWQQLIALATALVAALPNRPMEFHSAIAPGLDLEQLTVPTPWQSAAPRNLWQYGSATLQLTVGQFCQQALETHLGFAMAGTATEQLVGLGQPVITLAGTGPQFTPAFAEAQTRLLGPSVTLAGDIPRGVQAVRSLLDHPHRWTAIAQNGRDRLGPPGAAHRIARHLLKIAPLRPNTPPH